MSGHGCQCGQAHGACTTEFQYAVKIVCGEMKPGADGSGTPVAPGRYCTAVNVHNFDKCKDAHFRFKLAVALERLDSPISPYFGPYPLTPDRALEIDCSIIMQIAKGLFPGAGPSFVKGFLILTSNVALDVVAVYSGSTGPCGSNTFQTERVQGRCVPVCEDLILPLNTGLMGWQTVSPAIGPVVTLSNLPGAWAGASSGFTWVSQAGSDSTNAATIWRRYELCFELCDGFAIPSANIPIHVLAASTAEVSLNGSGALGSPGNVGTVPNAGYTAPHLLYVHPALLKSGRNCFRIDVHNLPQHGGSPTGFALTGILSVVRGKCPCVPLPIIPTGTTGPIPDHATAAFFAQTQDSADAG
jgi:hypothetical protein